KLRFSGSDILVGNINPRFEGVQLRIIEHLPPGPPDDGVLWLRYFPAVDLLVRDRSFDCWPHVLRADRTTGEEHTYPEDDRQRKTASLSLSSHQVSVHRYSLFAEHSGDLEALLTRRMR